MNPVLVKYLAFPLHEYLTGRKTFQFLSLLEKSQWYSPHDLKELQFNKLKMLLKYAYENVPFYRQQFKKIGLCPKDIKDFTDFKKFPILAKKDIRKNLPRLRVKDCSNRVKLANTSGTSGESLVFYLDNIRMSYDKAAKFRYRKWWNVDIGDKEVVLWGSPVELTSQNTLKNFRDKLFNSILLSAFNMTRNSMEKYVEILLKFRPKMIEAYPNSIYLFAKYISDNKINIERLKLNVIMCTGETLYDFQKKLIEAVFKCPVANGYGSREAGFIACECPKGNMHICVENVYIEILPSDQSSSSKEGEIVVTHLDMYTMPFIRYRTGDIGVLSDKQCACGRGLPLIKTIKGRSSDFFLTPTGKFIHGLAFDYILEEMEGIERFKVIQKSIYSLVIQVLRLPGYNSINIVEIIRKMKILVGDDINIKIEYVKDIPVEKSGKYRYVVSEVAEV